MTLLECLDEGRIGVAFPDEEAQGILAFFARGVEQRKRQKSEKKCANFHRPSIQFDFTLISSSPPKLECRRRVDP